MMDPIWRSRFIKINQIYWAAIKFILKNLSELLENCFSGIFGIADYRFSFRFKKFKMAYAIWRSRFIKINQIYLKMGFWGC